MKRLIIVLIILLMAVSMVYISFKKINISMKDLEENQVRIVLITKMKYGDYWKMVKRGAESAAKEFNVELIFDAPNKENDIEDQIELLDYYISQKVDGIVLAASDYNLLVSKVNEAFEAKIPIILIDSNVNTDNYLKSFSTDNYNAGKKTGEEVIRFAGDNVKVGIVSFVKGSENAIQREKGLRDYLLSYSNITILKTNYCMSSSYLAEEITEKYIYDDKVDVVIGLNAIASIGMGNVVEKDKSVIAIGFDTTLEEITHLDKGVINATIVQNPFGMGYLGVKYAFYGYKGNLKEYKDKDVLIDTFVITKENMFLSENQKLVFPFNSK